MLVDTFNLKNICNKLQTNQQNIIKYVFYKYKIIH